MEAETDAVAARQADFIGRRGSHFCWLVPGDIEMNEDPLPTNDT